MCVCAEPLHWLPGCSSKFCMVCGHARMQTHRLIHFISNRRKLTHGIKKWHQRRVCIACCRTGIHAYRDWRLSSKLKLLINVFSVSVVGGSVVLHKTNINKSNSTQYSTPVFALLTLLLAQPWGTADAEMYASALTENPEVLSVKAWSGSEHSFSFLAC